MESAIITRNGSGRGSRITLSKELKAMTKMNMPSVMDKRKFKMARRAATRVEHVRKTTLMHANTVLSVANRLGSANAFIAASVALDALARATDARDTAEQVTTLHHDPHVRAAPRDFDATLGVANAAVETALACNACSLAALELVRALEELQGPQDAAQVDATQVDAAQVDAAQDEPVADPARRRRGRPRKVVRVRAPSVQEVSMPVHRGNY